MKPSITPQSNKVLRILVPAVFWLAVWWAVAAAVGHDFLVPAPPAVLKRLAELAVTAGFWKSTLLSLLRIFCGGLAGVVLGTLLAVLTCRFTVMDWIFSPAIRVVRAVPVASFILLVLLWVKTGRVPGVISALIVIPVIWENVCSGIRNTDPLLLEMGRVYHLSAGRTAASIYLPSVLPAFRSGLSTAIGLAWKSGVAAEVLCLPKQAIGTQVYYSKIYLETPSLFAWTAVVIVLSFGLEKLVRALLRRTGGRNEA